MRTRRPTTPPCTGRRTRPRTSRSATRCSGCASISSSSANGTNDRHEALQGEIDAQVDEAFAEADSHGSVKTGDVGSARTMFDDVYAEVPRHLREQREQDGGPVMTAMTMIEAIRDAHVVAMERDDDVVVFGEDVGYFGGVFRCTQGLQERFGDHRCFDSPISEAGIVGAAVGMAAYGLRPCVEIQFADYMYPGLRPDRVRGGAAASPIGR